MTPSVSVHDVAVQPEWVPHTYDLEGTNLTSVFVPRDSRADLLFLGDEFFNGRFQKATFQATAVAQAVTPAPRAPLHFIFHTSFCCSTLLTRALDVTGSSMALREPVVLLNLANRLARRDDAEDRSRLDLVLRLLERPFDPDETIIVKPTNFANRIAETALSLRPQSKAILLYSDVESFSQSLLMRGIAGRIYGRKLYNQFASWSSLNFRYNSNDLLEHIDIQMAALGWLMQIHHFDAVARTFGPDRILILNSADLIADPRAALRIARAHFDLKLSEEEIQHIATGPVFAKHSKVAGQAYDPQSREHDHKAIQEAYASELALVRDWTTRIAQHFGTPMWPDL
jgi:hypothetical protein